MRTARTQQWAKRSRGPWHWVVGSSSRSWPKSKCGRELTGDPTKANFEGLPPYPEGYEHLDAQAKARVVCPVCAQAFLAKEAEREARRTSR